MIPKPNFVYIDFPIPARPGGRQKINCQINVIEGSQRIEYRDAIRGDDRGNDRDSRWLPGHAIATRFLLALV
jgi:hypothetical protein